MESDLVRYSRAGDVFHYRWAARRCLKLLDPTSKLEEIFIEGSRESKLSGECSIDLAEYSEGDEIKYFQLKHTTTQNESPFSFIHLKDTLKRFLERFAELPKSSAEFYFVTNRSVSSQLKKDISKIASGKGQATANFRKISNLTSLDTASIQKFCERLHIFDTEDDFRVQKHHLRSESVAYFTSSAESIELDSLIALVSDRALPVEDGNEPPPITKEDVLMQFQVSSEAVLFPAPPKFDIVEHPQKREFHDDLKGLVLQDDKPLIVQASGGVGKTVVAQQLIQNLGSPHHGIIYDCFGNGSYRNPSEPRHPARVALVQLANELARDGLCSPLIPLSRDRDHSLFSAFKDRITQAIAILRESDPLAKLVIILDAADNSEMAAAEMSESGFAKLLFREDFPEGCKLVVFSRPGLSRVELLSPPASCGYFDLLPFSPSESVIHLRSIFPDASLSEGDEFHKLSQGNPRVQAFALSEETKDINTLLKWLGPNQTTVEDLIKGQLDAAITKLRDTSPKVTEAQISSVCRCLSSLPPCIPKEILASAARLNVADIDSFVADLGRPLWISENLVYFRDEPTESWFRESFSTGKDQVSEMIAELSPFADTSAYVAKALPSLLHKAERHDDLLALALSDHGLPKKTNSAELKAIAIQRTQFAFKASLREGRLLDACKLAFKAAEEMSGTERVDELLKRHSNVVASFLSPTSTQELALSRKISAGWNGSVNIYTALLLSEHEDFRGQALSFLRTSRQWLRAFLDNDKNEDDDSIFDQGPALEADELATLARAILNLKGVKKTVSFLNIWTPKIWIYEITKRLAESLIDSGRIDDVKAILHDGADEPYIVIGCCEKLIEVCIVPAGKPLEVTLQSLSDSSELIEMPRMSMLQRIRHLPLVAFCEAAAANNLDSLQIKIIIQRICDQAELTDLSYYEQEPRMTFFRAHSLRLVLDGQSSFEDSEIWEKITSKNGDHSISERDKLPGLFGKYLFPWFLRRTFSLLSKLDTSFELKEIPDTPTAQELSHKGHEAYQIGYEAAQIWSEVLGFSRSVSTEELSEFTLKILKEPGKRIRILETLHLAQIVFRHEHLSGLTDSIELFCQNFIEVTAREPEEECSEYHALYAKAIFPFSKSDAAAHFGKAIEATSKFGHELNERWRAIAAVATQAAKGVKSDNVLCQRFFRCAEVVAEGIAREKYWDRCETFAVGFELNPSVAFAAWSRWRDRRLISWRPTLFSMAKRAIEKRVFPPCTAWPLTGFIECNTSAEFHSDCINLENDPEVREAMTNTALRDLRLARASREDFETLSKIIGPITDLDDLAPIENRHVSTGEPSFSSDDSTKKFDRQVSKLLARSDLLGKEGLRKTIKGFDQLQAVRYPERFWQAIVKSIPRQNREAFLSHLLVINEFDFYDLRNVLPELEGWKTSAAIQKVWPDFLEGMGSRFPESVLSFGSFEHCVEYGPISSKDFSALQKGVFTSFSETTSLHGGSTFLGFVCQNVTQLTGSESQDLLDFALNRMESHVADDFGEGLVEIEPENLSPLSGLLWSCLGSPYSSERWQAMHTIRRLALTKNQLEIDHLVERMKREKVGHYGCSEYVFYFLHAKLYLLTALNRVAKDNCELLTSHAEEFMSQALNDPAHLLIQRTAAGICLKIADNTPSTYTHTSVEKLKFVGFSPFPLETQNQRSELKEAPWEFPKTPECDGRHFFENDFGWYWFPELRGLFSIGQNHIEYLAKNFIETSLGQPQEKSRIWLEDKRSNSRSSQYSRSENFYHSHSSYPSADTFQFYCEYHSFLHAAKRLLETTPVTQKESDWTYEADPFAAWISAHSLTLEDGTWLSERRDPAPRLRRSWTGKTINQDWKKEVGDEDFKEILHYSVKLDNWLILHGEWNDCENSANETLRVKSALVDPRTADALGRFLSCQESPYDFSFPLYSDEDSSIDVPPFAMKGIILRNSENSYSLPSQDPYAGDLSYPSLKLASEYADLLDIQPNSENREWRKDESSSAKLKCEIWNEQGDEAHKSYPSGRRISCDKDLLVELCEKTAMDLILCVEIHRSYDHDSSYRRRKDRDEKIRGSHFKIFILSANGQFRSPG